MREFSGGNFEIQHDVNATRVAHMARQESRCGCNSCRNFDASIKQCPDQVKQFLNGFGLRLLDYSEIYDIPEFVDERGLLVYGGWYHFVGQLIKGELPHNPLQFFELESGFEYAFSQQIALLPNGFPQKVLQLEISFHLPWVLDEKR